MTKNTSSTPAQRTRKLYAEEIAYSVAMACLYTLQIVIAVWIAIMLFGLSMLLMDSPNEHIFYVNITKDIAYVLLVVAVTAMCLLVPSWMVFEFEAIRDTASYARRIARITVKRQFRKLRS